MNIRSLYKTKVKRLSEQLSRDEKIEAGSSIIRNIHAADIADLISNLSDEKQVSIFDSLDGKQKGDVFVELPEDVQAEVIQESDKDKVFDLLQELEPDEAVDLLTLLPSEEKEQLLSQLPKHIQTKLRQLLSYSEESAGGIMTPILMKVGMEARVSEVLDLIKACNKEEMLLYVYVVDEEHKLTGVVPLQEIAIAEKDCLVKDIMQLNPIVVNAHDDQEFVAQTVYKYNLYAVPVVNNSGQLLGRVTIDDAVAVAHEEAVEDAYLMAGMDAEEVHIASGFTVACMRLPWLLTCLLGSLISAFVLNHYEATLTKYIALITFLPAICAMGGNSGLQTSTVTIRNLTYGEVFNKNLRQVIQRELLSGFIIGVGCSLFVATISTLWIGSPIYGLAIGISMFFTIFLSTCSGFFVPLFFNRIGIDPAISSGPLITTINDAMSALTYLSVATYLFHVFA